jgi:hypothetical protein
MDASVAGAEGAVISSMVGKVAPLHVKPTSALPDQIVGLDHGRIVVDDVSSRSAPGQAPINSLRVDG